MTPEDLLTAVVRGDETEWPADERITEAAFAEATRTHGLLPIVARQLRLAGTLGAWPVGIRDRLQRGAVQHAAVQQVLNLEVTRVVDALAADGVRVLLLKGAAFAQTLYAHPCLRPRSDTDLLVSPTAMDRATHAMISLGYARFNQVSGGVVRYQAAFARTGTGGVRHMYDIHSRVSDRQRFSGLPGFDACLPSAIRVPALGEHAWAPGPVHALLIACVHRVAHHHDTSEHLLWIYDIDRLARVLTDADWAAFVSKAGELGVAAICGRGLGLATRWFGTPVEARIALLSPTGTAESDAYLRAPMRTIDILVDDLRCLPGWRSRARLLREHLFPPASYMRQHYGTGRAGLLPLYYVQRLVAGVRPWFRQPDRIRSRLALREVGGPAAAVRVRAKAIPRLHRKAPPASVSTFPDPFPSHLRRVVMSSMSAVTRPVRLLVAASTLALVVVDTSSLIAQNGAKAGGPAPNYELASAWTPQRVGKLVFDTSITPRWLEKSDRFWYAFNTREGRRFLFVDPLKKSKAPLFDHAKMAATLTSITRIPYNAQHLPFSTVRFVKDDTVFEFEVQVPRDAVIASPPKKTITTDQQAGRDVLDDERDMEWDPQQGQRGRGGAAGAAPAPRTRTLHFEYEMATGRVTYVEDYKEPARLPRWGSLSPDGKIVVFARNHNLYMMDEANWEKAQKSASDTSIVETQLTKDGEEHYSYARTVGAAQREQEQQQQQEENEGGGQQQETERESDDKNARVPAVPVVWAQDSSKFSLARRDARKVKDLWVINALAAPRPTLETYRYAMPGEENIPQSEIYVFDVAAKSGLRVKADRFKDQTLSVATKPQRAVGGGGRGGGGGGAQGPGGRPIPAQWLSASSSRIYMTRVSRDLHKLDVLLADTSTGEVTSLIEERLNTYIESKPLRLVNGESDLIFWSERDGWGHFYLYDAKNGTLKNRMTEGEFVATSLESVDDKARQAYITAAGREKGEDPYYTHLYRVGLDGTGMTLLNPGDASHATSLSESNRYFVNNASRVNGAPEATLYDTLGGTVTKLETPDLSALMEMGFKYPEPFTVKADDGVTDLYGVMYKPFDFDPERKYPIIAYVYPGPQTEAVTKTFNPRSVNISLAQFGFIVIEVGNRGGHPTRSKWYHNFGYGNLRDYGLPDKKAAIEQLARRHPFIDIDRVGIWGHSGGGFMSAAAMLVYPDFFKVAFSEAGNHENNIYNNTWSEKHHGIKEVEKDGKTTFEYDIEKNSELAKNLKGHLMLVHGDIDNNVHPANTYRLADALIKANKRFDMFILPGVRHSFNPVSGYVNWLRGDYFARHLLGASDEAIDIVQLNREREQTGDRRR